MDLTHIPKSFWHALSISIVALTFGFLIIAYRSSTISIEVANTKIALTKAASDVEKTALALQVKAKAVTESQRELLSSRTGTPLSDSTPTRDCSDLSPEAKLDCERLKALEKLQGQLEQATQAATKAATALF